MEKVMNHTEQRSLQERSQKRAAALAGAVGVAPGRVLCIGNTAYLTKEFIDETFPGSKVTVAGNAILGSADQIKLFRTRKPSVEALFETYDFDVVIYFSKDLTYKNTEKSDAEELREVLEYAKNSEKSIKILFVSSLDSSFYPKNDRAILTEAKENLCRYYAENSALDIKILQIPYLYSGQYSNDFLYNVFDRIQRKKTVILDVQPQGQMRFLTVSDLSSLIMRVLDNWNNHRDFLTVGDDFGLTFSDFTQAVSKLCANAKFDFAGTSEAGELEIDYRHLRTEYGWFSKISILECLEEEYEKYLVTKQEKVQTLWQKTKKWAEAHSQFVKTGELILLFLITELLVHLTDSAVIFSIVDFRMAYIYIMATAHGLTWGLWAAGLSSVSWLAAKVASGTSLLTIFYEPTNWLSFVFFFLIGALCGYIKLRKDDTIRFVSEQNKLLEEKLAFTREIYEDTYKEKRDLKKQIIGSKDSLGKIFDVARKLDTVAPQLLYLQTMETFEDVLENKSISVYSLNNQHSTFGRLEVASRDIIKTVPRSVPLKTYSQIIEKLNGGEIWRNTELNPEYPMYAAGVYRGEELVLLIFLWHADMDQHSLYYVNLFKILRDLVQMSLLRAFDYNQAISEKQYIEHTSIMNAEAFDKVLSDYATLSEKKVSKHLVLEIETNGRSYEQMDQLLQGTVRANDIVGASFDGKLRILLSQATKKDLPYILPRFESAGLEAKLQ